MNRTVIAAALAAASFSSFAAVENYTIEASHTYPSFEASHMGISVWRGKFNTTAGKVTLDRAAKTGTVDITIDAKSVDFGHDKMNEHARGDDFFKVEKFPTITYKGKLSFTGDTPTGADGELTLLGVTKPVKLTINSFKCIPHPFFKVEVCGADVSGQFDRVDFGMDYGAKYGPTVAKLAIQVEALKDAAPGPRS